MGSLFDLIAHRPAVLAGGEPVVTDPTAYLVGDFMTAVGKIPGFGPVWGALIEMIAAPTPAFDARPMLEDVLEDYPQLPFELRDIRLEGARPQGVRYRSHMWPYIPPRAVRVWLWAELDLRPVPSTCPHDPCWIDIPEAVFWAGNGVSYLICGMLKLQLWNQHPEVVAWAQQHRD
jgi:hypothetical protein